MSLDLAARETPTWNGMLRLERSSSELATITPERSALLALDRHPPAPEIADLVEDVAALVGRLLALDGCPAADRWRHEQLSYEALARAKRAMRRCAAARGLD